MRSIYATDELNMTYFQNQWAYANSELWEEGIGLFVITDPAEAKKETRDWIRAAYSNDFELWKVEVQNVKDCPKFLSSYVSSVESVLSDEYSVDILNLYGGNDTLFSVTKMAEKVMLVEKVM